MDQKRRKVMVCDFCRKRKIKCDKAIPCSSCVKYKRQCSYDGLTLKQSAAHVNIDSTRGCNNTDQSVSLPSIKPFLTGNSSDPNDISGKLGDSSALDFNYPTSIAPSMAPNNNLFGSPNLPIPSPVSQSSQTNNHLSSSSKVKSSHVSDEGASDGINQVNSPTISSMLNPLDDDELLNHLHTLASKIEALEQTIKADKNFEEQYDSDDEMNFDDFDQTLINNEPIKNRHYGYFSWVTAIKYDVILSKLWESNKKLLLVNNYNYSNRLGLLKDTETNGELKVFNYELYKTYNIEYLRNRPSDFLQNYNQLLGKQLDTYSINRSYDTNIVLNDSFRTKFELIQKIESVLPNVKIIQLMLDIYFANLYPSFPFLNEQEFRDKIKVLINDDSSLNVRNKLDFAYLGILLIIFRLVSVSLLLDDFEITKAFNERLSILSEISKPINVQFIQLSQLCMNQFNLLVSINLTVFQLVLFFKSYHVYGPEFGAGPDEGESQILSGVLTQLAYNLGLHREPSTADEKYNNLVRLLWYHVCIIDYNTNFILGDPLNIVKFYYNVELPNSSSSGSNTIDPEVGKTAGLLLASAKGYFRRMNRLYHIFFSSETFSINQTYVYLNEFFGKITDEDTRIFNGLINESGIPSALSLYNTYKAKFVFSGIYISLSIFNHFYNHLISLKKPEKAMRFLIRNFKMIYKTFLPLYYDQLLKPANIKSVSKLIILPYILCAIQKILFINVSVLIRLQIFDYRLYQTEETKNKLQLLKNSSILQKSLHRSMMFFESILSKLSSEYYYSWKILKIQDLLVKEINIEQFQDLPIQFGFTVQNMRILNDLIITALNDIDVTKGKKDGTDNSSNTSRTNEEMGNPDKLWLLLANYKNNVNYNLEEYYKEIIIS